MKIKQVTPIVITIVVLLVGIYDIAAFAFGGVDATVSRVLLGGGSIVPAIPFSLGFIFGHLFWPQKS